MKLKLTTISEFANMTDINLTEVQKQILQILEKDKSAKIVVRSTGFSFNPFFRYVKISKVNRGLKPDCIIFDELKENIQ